MRAVADKTWKNYLLLQNRRESREAIEGVVEFFYEGPERSELVLKFEKMGSSILGEARTMRGEIAINSASPYIRSTREMLDTLLHEIRHFWQEEAGFSFMRYTGRNARPYRQSTAERDADGWAAEMLDMACEIYEQAGGRMLDWRTQ